MVSIIQNNTLKNICIKEKRRYMNKKFVKGAAILTITTFFVEIAW